MLRPDRATFIEQARQWNVVPVMRRLLSDQVSPVLAYRRLVSEDDRSTSSFLLESVEVGGAVGRHSLIGARPMVEFTARAHEVTRIDHRTGDRRTWTSAQPYEDLRADEAARAVAPIDPYPGTQLPGFTGGWCGFAGYDTVRYAEPERLGFDQAPSDDRGLPDMQFGLYRELVVFDHVDKMMTLIVHVAIDEHDSPEAAYEAAERILSSLAESIQRHSIPLTGGAVTLNLAGQSPEALHSNMTRDSFEQSVERCREYIRAGDAFQIVPSQRFERVTPADPFTIYRALRVVNPSPYMIYMQTPEVILVASSPEILCRVQQGCVVSRPLAGTRRRGATPEDDAALAAELQSDEKECAEHAMLVDLARNDLGRVCDASSISIDRLMAVEQYSHVMHLSSTVTGTLRAGVDSWDALQQSLPVGTVSGAPKVRAMEIIDELEPTRRGPYAGGIGGVGFNGDMDIAIALRTFVIPNRCSGGQWTVYMQAGAGVVLDSDPAAEYDETVNKAAALGRAVDLAESLFAE